MLLVAGLDLRTILCCAIFTAKSVKSDLPIDRYKYRDIVRRSIIYVENGRGYQAGVFRGLGPGSGQG